MRTVRRAAAATALALAVTAPAALAEGPEGTPFILENPLGLASVDLVGGGQGEIVEGGHSGVFPVRGQRRLFWLITDRGPNGNPTINGAERRTFPVPGFAPEIKLAWAGPGGRLRVLARIPLRLRLGAGDPVRADLGLGSPNLITGFPNLPDGSIPSDEVGVLADGTPTGGIRDPYGLDTEGIAQSADGTFWLAEEYRPSLVQVSPFGTVLRRIVPAGTPTLGDESVLPVDRALPAIYNARRRNRGFEGVAVSRGGGFVYGIVQNALQPAGVSGSQARLRRSVRLVEVALRGPGAPRVSREFLYRIDANTTGKPAADPQDRRQDQYRVGDMFFLRDDALLVTERDDCVRGPDCPQHKLVYEVDLSAATDLGTLTGANATARDNGSLDGFTDAQLAAAGVAPTPKTEVLSVGDVYPYDKLEGVAAVGRDEIAVVNDNDFAVGAQANITAAQPAALFQLKNPVSELTIYPRD